MNRYGSINIHERINLWRRDGWKGFNVEAEAVENVDSAKTLPVLVTTPITNTPTTRVTPIAPDASPITVVPVEPVVETGTQIDIDDEDTAETLPVPVTAPITDTPISVAPIPNAVTTEPVVLNVAQTTNP